MLKLLYKTILISVMSCSLMTMNMTAFAQDATTSTMTKSAPTTLTAGANGALTSTTRASFTGVKDSDMLSSITMLVIGAVGARMATNYKPMTTDVLIAAAAAAAFIAGEVMSTMANKKTMEDMTMEITKTNTGTSDQTQIQRLQDLKKSYEEAKKSIGTKKMFQLAAAAGFAGAAAMAVYMSFQDEAMVAACTAATTTAQAGLATCVTTGKAAAAAVPVGTVAVKEGLQCEACASEMTEYKLKMETYDKESKIVGPPSPGHEVAAKPAAIFLEKGACMTTSGMAAKGIAMGVNGACKPALSFKRIIQTFSPTPVAGVGENDSKNVLNQILYGGNRSVASYEMYQSKETNFIEKGLDLLMPRAEASMMSLLGLGAGAAASFFLIKGTLGTAIDTMMYVPLNRAIIFGVLAGLAFMASKASQDQMDQIDANIAKIDQILNELNNLQNGVQTGGIASQTGIQLAGLSANPTQGVQINPNASVTTDCIASPGSSNCASVSGQLTSMPDFSNLPTSLQSIASQTAQLGNGLSGTNVISGSTLTAASSLAGKQNAIAKLLAKSQKQLNDLLAKDGKPKIDFANEQKNLLNRLNSQTANALRSSGMSAGDFLSSIGGTPFSSSGTSGKAADTGAKKSFGTANSGGSSFGKEKGMDLDFKEAKDAAALGADGASQKDGKFDIGANDINVNSGESIFVLISNRYIKSGYPKLLEEIPAKK